MSETRDRILGLAARFGARRVDIEALGGPVWIRPASIRCVANMGDIANQAGQIAAGARLIIDCLVEEDGTPVLVGLDEQAVMCWPVQVFNDVLAKVQDVCGMTGTEVEDARKNSPTTP